MNDDTPRNRVTPDEEHTSDAHRPDDDHFASPAALDRGIPDLGQSARRSPFGWVIALAIVVVTLGGAVWIVHDFLARHEAAEQARRNAVQDQAAQGRIFGTQPVPAEVASAARPAIPTIGAPASRTGAPPPASHTPRKPVRSYYDAPLLVTGAGADGRGRIVGQPSRSSATSATSSSAFAVGDRAGRLPSPSTSSLAQALTPTRTPRVQAGFIGNRGLLLSEGTKIDCAGDTAFDSTQAGISTCTVTRNVYSDDGRVVLIERGSQINCEYRSNLSPGQKRVFILAARIETPHGVSVQIDSPAADALGRIGVGGYVDNHWGARIGAALLLGMSQDAIGYLATRGGNSNGSIVYENTQQQGNDMASRVLERTINIPPTLKQNQGAEFTIVLARDVDFSPVYALEPENVR